MRKTAFTLAEVMITLLLIGIIAALTVPDLYMNFEQAYLRNKYISTLAVLNEATKMMKNDYGGRLNGVLGYDGIGLNRVSDDCPNYELSNPSNSTNPEDNIMEMYSRYLSWIKKYPAEEGRTGIFKYRSGSNSSEWDLSDESILVLANGASIAWGAGSPYACEETYSSREGRPVKAKYNHPCVEEVPIDLNGPRGPNIRGIDVQFISVYADRVTSPGICRYDTTAQEQLDECRLYGWACGFLWQKGISVYFGST